MVLKYCKQLGVGLVLSALAATAGAQVQVRDDAGQMVTLNAPARRVISLAPHVTELIYAAGGGARLVGVVSHSDYPEAAKQVPRVGDNRQVDIERVLALKPDLLVVWLHGNAERQLEPLRRLGVPLFYSEPTKLEAIPETLLKLGTLMGSEPQAQAAAGQFRQRLAGLRQHYAQARPLRVFYQVWDQPLYTIGGGQIISDALAVCGASNVFDHLKLPAPQVGIESVLQRNPEVIIAGTQAQLDAWKAWPQIDAVKHGRLLLLADKGLERPSGQMLEATARLCEQLQR